MVRPPACHQSDETSQDGEEKFRLAFENAPYGMATIAPDGRYLAVNPALCRMFGYTREELLAGTIDLVTHPDDLERSRQWAQRVIGRGGDEPELEKRYIHRDGHVVWGLVRAGWIFDSQGGPRFSVVHIQDITERRQVQLDLQESKALLQGVVENLPLMVFLKEARDLKFVIFNQAGEDLVGMDRSSFLGRNDFDFFPPEQAARFMAQDRVVLNGELDLLDIPEEPIMTSGKGLRLLHTRKVCLHGADGVSKYLLGISEDITDRKCAEETLRESNRRLGLALTSGSLGIWELDLADGAQIWNDRMFELYGLEPRARHPDHAFWRRHIVHPEDLEAAEAAIQAAFAGTRPYDVAFRIVRPDGQVRHIKSNGCVLRDAGGKAVRVVGINRDQTHEVEAEAERRRLQMELMKAEHLESIGSLAGGVAHDLNNVLAAIMGMASTLEADSAGPEVRARALQTITRACVRGRDVVKSLLYFARKDLEALGPVNLNAIAGEMVHLLSHTTLKRLRITTDFQEPLGLIEGDGGALSHALINLCVNAVDAMPEGGSLEIRTRGRAEWGVEISIRDTGTGMSPETVRRATEPFFTTKAVGKGTGLGLAMVYGTVQAHKGTFEIRSEEGRGTEVILGFPYAPKPQGRAGAPGEDPPARPAHSGEALHILLVDDDELIRMAIAPMLMTLGHTVQTAESGQEALARIQDGLAADLVILDMNMPDLNGAQTLARLLALRPGQRVLMATGYSDDAIAPLLKDHPNVHSLRKPFSVDEVRNKLATMLD